MIVMAINFVPAADFDLRINEIMYHPAEEDDYNEWVEIYNHGDSDMNLENMTLCGSLLLEGYIDRDGELHDEDGLVLEEGKYAIITDGGSGTEVYDNFNVSNIALALHVDGSTLCTGLNNDGETITLEFNESIIDEIEYEDDADTGYSLEYVDGEFVQSQDEGGTPGSENGEYEETEEDENNNEDDNSEDDADDSSNNEDEEEQETENTETLVDDSGNDQEAETVSSDFQEISGEKIVLNPVSESEESDSNENENKEKFISSQEKLRMWVIYSFLVFTVILIILLALRKL